MNSKKSIFKNSSTTYYYSSLFFPKKIWEKISTVYAFVRIADNFIDDKPQNVADFNSFVKDAYSVLNGKKIAKNKYSKYIIDFIKLAKENDIKLEWIEAFFQAMKSDISKEGKWIKYSTHKELDHYIYGSAEVIGLMMAKILNLCEESYVYAKMQGSAMQFINFIRDINEDCQLKRQYLPSENFRKFSVKNLCSLNLNDKKQAENFKKFIRNEIETYTKKQKKAFEGYKFIPLRYKLPILTASDLYMWTAKVIYKNPLIVFEKKIKPSKSRVFFTLIKNSFLCFKY